MRRGLKLVAALGLVAAMAVPAMADVNLNGFYRARGYVTNAFDYAGGTILPSADANGGAKAKSYVDQRYRGKLSAGDENVKAVAFFEIDSQWGDSSATVARNQGAGLQGDSINLETKNVYLWFKIPDTSVDFTVGLQNVTDSYAGVFMGAADLAGVVSSFKFEPVSVRLGYLVPWQPNRDKSTSTTFYMAEAKFAPTKDVKVGANMYFLRDGGTSFNPGGIFDNTAVGGTALAFTNTGANLASFGGTTKIYMPGVDFSANLGVANLTGFVFGQFGDRNYFDGSQKTKFSSYAGDLRADVNAGPAKVFVEGLYVSGDNYDGNSNKYKGVIVMDDFKFNSGSSTYARTDMVFLFPAADSINTGSGLAYDANNNGLGVIHLAAGAAMPIAPKTTAKIGVGYLAAAKKLSVNSNSDYFNFRNKSDMGTEVNATLSYNVSKGLDTALTGAYVFLGGAYDKNKAGSATMDPKNPYAAIAKVNYAF